MSNMEWNPPETAPKDEIILAKFKYYPYPVQAYWNAWDERWVYPSLQVQPIEGQMIDAYFETEWEHNYNLEAWAHLIGLEDV